MIEQRNRMICFSKEHTFLLKGVALLIMIIHHTCNPEIWSIEGTIYYSFLTFLGKSTKICVYIFAFLVGYGFYWSRNKTFKYSLKRSVLLLFPFWVMLFFIFVPLSVCSGTFGKAVGDLTSMDGIVKLIYNMFGVSESLNWYSWFVNFYILSIFFLPIVHSFIEKYSKYGWVLVWLGCYFVECIIHIIPGWDGENLLHSLFFFFVLFPIVLIGYMSAKWNSQGLIPSWFEGRSKLLLSLVLALLVLIVNGIGFSSFGFCIQAIYTPLLIFSIIGILNSCSWGIVGRTLVSIGKVSMYMWFFHAVFFTESVNMYTKNIVFSPFHNFLYTLFVTVVFSFVCARLIKFVITPIINRF